MSVILAVNMAASVVMVVGFTAFLVFLFGRPNSMIHRLDGAHRGFVKAALAGCAAGALLNLLTLSEPPPSELVLNVSMAILFGWAAWFHWVRFVRGGGIERRVVKRSARRRKTT